MYGEGEELRGDRAELRGGGEELRGEAGAAVLRGEGNSALRGEMGVGAGEDENEVRGERGEGAEEAELRGERGWSESEGFDWNWLNLERMPELITVPRPPVVLLGFALAFVFAYVFAFAGEVFALDLATAFNGAGFARPVFSGAMGGLSGAD